MGYAIAEAAAELGACVNLISGKVNLRASHSIKLTHVDSALQMHQAALAQACASDIFIACAAVADYRPDNIADDKIKKEADTMVISMIKNPDIVADVAALNENRPFTVGFAAETQNLEAYAKDKMQRKKLDMICANDVAHHSQGFNSDNNALLVLSRALKDGRNEIEKQQLPLTNKKALARTLIEVIIKQYKKPAK
jgi:phosphopantothenoylcysteine decarboxylase/phosphopantothenate--cysteine ligase